MPQKYIAVHSDRIIRYTLDRNELAFFLSISFFAEITTRLKCKFFLGQLDTIKLDGGELLLHPIHGFPDSFRIDEVCTTDDLQLIDMIDIYTEL